MGAQLIGFNDKQLIKMNEPYMFDGFVKYTQDDINDRLRRLGAVAYDIWLPETHSLPYILREGERIEGIVYGKYKQTSGGTLSEGRGALVVTNQRILLIDKKPLFLKYDELSRAIVTGVTYARAGIAATVILHTRAGDIHVRTMNKKCATTFVAAVENECFNGLDRLV